MRSRLLPPALALFLLSSACNVGLEPRHLGRLHYGIDWQSAVELLETTEIRTVLRFFVTDDAGRMRDCVVEDFWSLHPHPHYWLLHVDGTLAAVHFGWAPANDEFRPPYHRQRTPTTLRAFVDDAIASRLPLAWAELEPLDTARARSEPHPTLYTIGHCVVFFWMLPLVPVAWAMSEGIVLLGFDGSAQYAPLREYLMTVPGGTTFDAVVEALGSPQEVTDEGRYRTCLYKCGLAYRLRLGFDEQRLCWIEFTP